MPLALARLASSEFALPWSATMRSAKLRICGSWDLASAILPASISAMPAWAAIFTNAAGSGTALSASPAEAADAMPASARNNKLRETVIKIRSFV